MFFSRKKRVRSPPSSSDEETDAWEKEKQPQLFNFYEDDILNPNEVDHLLRDEMMQLSVRDRNKIFEEIHGVRCMAPDETPKFLERALLEIDSELAKIPIANKKAFLAATASRKNNSNQNNVCNNKNHDKNERKHGDCCGVCSVNFVDSAEFRLRFLRCELFDAKKAAQRLVNYLELITTMMPFKRGSELLKRPITLADFDEVEQSILRKGHLQLLPFRDRSGRRVLAGVASLGIRFDPLQWYKILLYFLWIAGGDVESQQKGIVLLLWPNPDIADSLKLRYPINRGGDLVKSVFECVPVRVAAFHFCTPENSPFFQVLRSVFALTLGRKRSRLKFHSGHPVELRYQISTYGIPVDLLPLTPTGNVKTTYLKHWLRLRNTVEEDINTNGYHPAIDYECDCSRGAEQRNTGNTNTNMNYATTKIECPGSFDVVFRPGRPVMNHPGNVAFRSLIESKSDQHDGATQTQKSTIVKSVVEKMIESRGGRFLTWDERCGCWSAIVDPNKQHHKVAIAFRNFKAYKKALGNCQTNDDAAMSVAFERLDHGTRRGRENNFSGGDVQKKRKRSCGSHYGFVCR